MELHKEQKNTANDLWKYEELQQKPLTILKIIVYITNNVVHFKVTITVPYS